LNAAGLVLCAAPLLFACFMAVRQRPEIPIIISALILILIVVAVTFLVIKRGDYSGYFEMDELGLSFQTPWMLAQMPWDTVRYITIHDRPMINFIGFFAEGFDRRPKMQNKKYSTFWLIDLNLIDDTFIFVEYREGMIEEIRRYWQGEIINEEKLL